MKAASLTIRSIFLLLFKVFELSIERGKIKCSLKAFLFKFLCSLSLGGKYLCWDSFPEPVSKGDNQDITVCSMKITCARRKSKN